MSPWSHSIVTRKSLKSLNNGVSLHFFLLSCSSANNTHQDWMKELLYRDNWRFLQRAPVALESKFQRMAEDPYTFMRGNLSIQVAHWSRLSQDRMTPSFLQTPESTMVPILAMPIQKI